MDKLPVIFRAERTKDADVTAVFPTLPHDTQGHYFTVYAHVGQHGAGAWEWYHKTRAAKPEEYAELLAELQDIYGRSHGEGDEAYELVTYARVQPGHRRAFRKEVSRLLARGNV